MNRQLIGAILLISISGVSANAQETSSDWAWKTIVDQDSVSIQYIFYSETDNRRDGIVLKLVNRNDAPVEYAFTVILRSGNDRVYEEEVAGNVTGGSILTGEDEGLFFEPFEDGSSIGMIGIRGLKLRLLERGDRY